jgi:hypothetical protein
MRHLLLVLVSYVLLVPSAAAQEAPVRSVTGEGSLSFTLGVPSGEFRDQIEDPGFGGSVFAGVRFGASPFVLGLDLNVLVYGRSRDTVPFSTTIGPRVLVDVVTTNSIVQPHLALRLQPADGLVRPYVDGLLGFKYLFTETSVRDDDRNQDDDPIASTTNFDDFAFSGGAGAGLDIRMYRGTAAGDVRDVSLHLGVQYLVGQEAEYLAEGDLIDDNNNGRLDPDELDVRRSTTTLIQPQIGVAVRF